MKTLLELLRIPLVKFIGIGLIIYFGLFFDKTNPDGLGNRLSSERIKQNFNEAQERGNFIMENISRARQSKPQDVVDSFDASQNFSQITFKDVIEGEGEERLKCGDEATISYNIHVVDSNNNLEEVENETLVIGSNKNALIEQKIIGMKNGGARIINIPRHFKSSNKKLEFLLKFNEADLQYNVNLVSFKASNAKNLNCKKR